MTVDGDSIARVTQDPINPGSQLASAFPFTAKYDRQWIRENALDEERDAKV
jgi:hypothetical protein